MSEPREPGVRREEIAMPERPVEQHIASGSGYEEDPLAERGGGKVPERNPWKDDPPVVNPATDGSGTLADPNRRR